MYDQLLNEVENLLAKDADVIVSVKKIWNTLKSRSSSEIPTPSLLEADTRFEFMPEHKTIDAYEGLSSKEREREELEMEKLGFYSGQRVKLRCIELTPEKLGEIIRRKVDHTMEALTKAWEHRPTGDQKSEDELLEILAQTQKLQREMKDAFSEEKMHSISTVLKNSIVSSGGRKKVKAKGSSKRKREVIFPSKSLRRSKRRK